VGAPRISSFLDNTPGGSALEGVIFITGYQGGPSPPQRAVEGEVRRDISGQKAHQVCDAARSRALIGSSCILLLQHDGQS
jgi:hypothetical protein